MAIPIVLVRTAKQKAAEEAEAAAEAMKKAHTAPPRGTLARSNIQWLSMNYGSVKRLEIASF